MQTKPTEVTPEHIADWKAKHGDVYELKITDEDGQTKKAYVKKPGRKTLSYASTSGQTDPMLFNEIVLKECFLGGDDVLTDDDDFLAASSQIGELIKFKEAELVKL
ncbi:hypothetical protein GCM10007424_23800 [Flavobacterium suaedae]|uniref:Phage tail assembly protein n=1 Tax=Flavobacterium suaedae TaxID=1767027 RepID=A0ABQ1K2K1_9FLAO|nr:hypothetical protein [Flavobacterium suaedae]GGB83016.1 hypothetical protein GCM10007424_23800 [Flavobacterium suaedae]